MTTTPTPVQRAATALAERGPIDDVSAVDIVTATLTAALDVDEIAQALWESDPFHGVGTWPDVPTPGFYRKQATALIEHLTGGGR